MIEYKQSDDEFRELAFIDNCINGEITPSDSNIVYIHNSGNVNSYHVIKTYFKENGEPIYIHYYVVQVKENQYHIANVSVAKNKEKLINSIFE